MWFTRSIELLPRVGVMTVLPAAVMLVAWLALRDLPVRIMGQAVSPLGLAVSAFVALRLVRGLPVAWASAAASGLQWVPIAAGLGATLFCGAAIFVLPAEAIQMAWTLGLLASVGLMAGFVFFSPGDIPRLPFRWKSDAPEHREFVQTELLFLALYAGLASLALAQGSVTDWVSVVTLGRIALWYLGQWVIIVQVLTRPDDD